MKSLGYRNWKVNSKQFCTILYHAVWYHWFEIYKPLSCWSMGPKFIVGSCVILLSASHVITTPTKTVWLHQELKIHRDGNRKQRVFPKLNINMTIQWQVLSECSLISQLYMLQSVNKKHPSTCFTAKHPKHNKLRLQAREKNLWIFIKVSHGRRL